MRPSTIKRGFTLIELLTVIMIVAILCAILFPVVFIARRSGQKVACLSNLHNIDLAIAGYAQDYDSRYPIGLDCTDGSYDNVSPYLQQNPHALTNMPLLRSVLHPYTRNGDIWNCPLDIGANTIPLTTPQGQRQGFSGTPTAFGALGTSYTYRLRFALAGSHFPGSCFVEKEDGSTDEWDVTRSPIVTEFRGWHGDNESDALSPTTSRYNVLFADGHVKNTDEGFVVGAIVCYPK